MNKFFIGVKLLQYTFEHWKDLLFNEDSDPVFFFDTLTERSQLWNGY